MRYLRTMDIPLAVNGTLMRGLKLNGNLTAAGAHFVREAATAPEYRLWSIGDRHPAVLREAALADADAIDRRLAAGEDPGPLAGVPFAAKNLFDVTGLTTLAGSKINADRPPATRDATAVARLRAAGAVLVGTLNMDE